MRLEFTANKASASSILPHKGRPNRMRSCVCRRALDSKDLPITFQARSKGPAGFVVCLSTVLASHRVKHKHGVCLGEPYPCLGCILENSPTSPASIAHSGLPLRLRQRGDGRLLQRRLVRRFGVRCCPWHLLCLGKSDSNANFVGLFKTRLAKAPRNAS